MEFIIEIRSSIVGEAFEEQVKPQKGTIKRSDTSH